MRFFTIAVSISLLVLSSQTANAIRVTHKLEGVDGQDIDILVENSTQLTETLKEFLKGQDSGLNQTIDIAITKAFDRMDETLLCFNNLVAAKINMGVQSLPVLNWFSTKEEKYCQAKFLSGKGFLNSILYERCVLNEKLLGDTWAMESVYAEYSSVKESLHAAYCNFKSNPESVEFKTAKEAYSRQGVLVSVYNSLSQDGNCSEYSPSKFHECAKEYTSDAIQEIEAMHPSVSERINLKELKSQVSTLEAPKIKGFFIRSFRFTPGSMRQHEDVLADMRIAQVLSKTIDELRIGDYQRDKASITPLINTADIPFRKNYDNGKHLLKHLGASRNATEKALKMCERLRKSARYSDLYKEDKSLKSECNRLSYMKESSIPSAINLTKIAMSYNASNIGFKGLNREGAVYGKPAPVK